MLTHRLPYAPNRGDRIRAHHLLRLLRQHATVELVSLVHDADEASHIRDLQNLVDAVHVAPVHRFRNWAVGACRLATDTPLTHALLDSGAVVPALRRIVAARRPDVVLAYCSGMARFAIEPPLAGLPLIIDLVDVDSLKWKDMAANSAGPMRWVYRREAKWLSRFEARAARCAFATTVVSHREAAALSETVPDGRIEVVPNGIDREHFRPRRDPSNDQSVVFCGVMNYGPNAQAAVWVAREVWPLVRRRCPEARLKLVGSDPTRAVADLPSADSTIEVTGGVADVRPYLWNAAVATAPLQIARGVQNKVLEAVAAGLPVVITPSVAGGLPAEILPACLVASTPAAFADAIVHFLNLAPGERRRVAESADLEPLSWNRRLAPFLDLLRSAVSEPREQCG